MISYEIVLARYNEDISWCDGYKNIFVCNKGLELKTEHKVLNLPNIGREAHSYLSYIVERYDCLPDVVCFFQADPNIQPLLGGEISENGIYEYFVDIEEKCSQNYSKEYKFGECLSEDYRIYQYPFGTWLNLYKTDGKTWFLDNIDQHVNLDSCLNIYFSAHFSVKKEAILSRSKKFYQKLLSQFSHKDDELAHFFERAWYYVFGLHWRFSSKDMKTVISIVGIRPDFIRMSKIFKKLDANFNHVLIHTGQHFDKNLSDSFFKEFSIRQPDFNLSIGSVGKEHFHQTSELSVKLIELFRKQNINPDLILFLGDSNSVLVAPVLKKEGYKIGHIEAGMRSGDRRMLEETNRIVCDHCSDLLFTYHENYKNNLIRENINSSDIYVVGNTIVEVCSEVLLKLVEHPRRNDEILLDIHRPENFKYSGRMSWILKYAQECSLRYGKPIKMLDFKRTTEYIKNFGLDLGNIKLIELMGYAEYLKYIYNCEFIISDSGTSQEEPAILGTKVVVPRDFTERPESVKNNCSFMLNERNFNESFAWIDSKEKIRTDWLGEGNTSEKIISAIRERI